MLITTGNGRTESASSELFPILHAGTQVRAKTRDGQTLSGKVFAGLQSSLILVGCSLPIWAEDVVELVIVEG
jgi:hypothetical protein